MENPSPASPSAVNVGPAVFGALLSAGVGALLLGLVGVLLGHGGVSTFALIGALGAFAWSLLSAVNRALAQSERRMLALLGRSTRPDVPAAAVATPADPPSTAAPEQAPEPPPSPGVPQPLSAPAPAPAPRPDHFATRGLRHVRAWFQRGNPIARVGIVILFIGGAFLVKYAADHALLPLELRLAAVATGAMLLLGLGWRLRDRQRVYALTLQGGGVAALYLTVYATLRLYQLIPPGIALTLMAAVSLAAAVLAVTQKAQALAVIGFAGGFAAPLLAASDAGDHIALFAYYTVLNLGVFAVAWARAWRALNLVGFVFTFGVSALWRGTGYTTAQWVSTDAFLLLFFVLYVAVSVLFALRQPPNLRGYVSGTLVFGLPVVVFALHGSLVAHIAYALAWSAFGFALFYLLLAWALMVTRRPGLRLLAEAFAALGVIFGSLAIPLAFDPGTTAAVWAVEGAGLLWLGIRQDRRLARAFGALLQLAAAAHYALAAMHVTGTAMPLLNSAWLGGAGLAVAGFLSGLWLQRARDRLQKYERGAFWAFLFWALFWWLAAGVNEIDRLVPFHLNPGVVLTFVAGSALLLDLLGRRARWPEAVGSAPFVATALLLLGSLGVLNATHPLVNGAWFGWPLLWLGSYWLLYRRDGDHARPLPGADTGLHAVGLWSLALVAASELTWQVAQQIGGVWPALAWGLVPALLLWLGAYASGWPLARHRVVYRFVAALPLAAVAVLWVLVTSLNSTGDPVLLIYLPLLNPLDIAVMLVLLALAAWWQALPAVERTRLRGGHPARLPALAATVVFLWLNSALIRAMHYTVGTPLLFDGILHSTPVQAALSLFWSLLGFAAMITATRRSLRPVWLCGAGLMAVVVVKLFVVDLSATGTLARIVSFLGVGALLLVTGYFSPLPPKRRTETTEDGT
ncbi:DUF2339 domain-containing protein [Polycyclovorans algicola]|uniref:DUF2339 domain-containing protein n=1 Tax=Polycyclovorans algicola TaxID=616992 RepID=UPI000693EDCC|nr:DUF2339 domain-containing protein [Polycyclovorans algicola]